MRDLLLDIPWCVRGRTGEYSAMASQIGAGVLAAMLALLVAYRVRQRNWPRAALGASVALVLTAYAADLVPTPPDVQEAVEDSADSLGLWLYPFIAGVAFLESFPPPFCAIWPGEFGVIFAGAIAAQDGDVEIVPLVAVVWVVSALADSASFGLGRRYGRGLLERHGRRVRVTPERLARLDRWFERWGTALVALGRLLPVARPLGPFVAGTSHLSYSRFLRWNLLGVTLFSLSFSLAGYAFYESYDEVTVVIGRAGFAVFAILVVAAAVISRRRRRAAR
jgi:membrane protein DedA with SNARE-associated domain